MIRFPLRFAAFAFALALIPACAAQTPAEAPSSNGGSPRSTILASSSPADGATLSRSPANLVLRFSRPARLHEVLVAGSDGSQMPVMVTAAGETGTYSLPLPDLEAGSYSVDWRAESSGQTYRGTIRFTIR